MTYTINGKEYTEFDINNAITGIRISTFDMNSEYNRFMAKAMRLQTINYTSDPSCTWLIIEKCWDALMLANGVIFDGEVYSSETEWDYLLRKHNCTKLVAACICFIEINEGGVK
jgi:hypothetical protein